MDRDVIDAIDMALFGIQQMVDVSLRATESLHGEDDPDIFQMPSGEANLLDFSLFDIAKRVKEARAMLYESDKPVKPTLSIVRD